METEHEAVTHVMRSFRKVNRALFHLLREEADILDLTALQLLVLKKLSKHQDIGLGELAEDLQVGNSTMSGVVERLVTAGLIIRERSSEDRRLLTMRLTPQGEKKQKEAFGGESLLWKKLSRVLEIPEKDLNHLLQTHEQMLEKLQREGDETINEESTIRASERSSAN